MISVYSTNPCAALVLGVWASPAPSAFAVGAALARGIVNTAARTRRFVL